MNLHGVLPGQLCPVPSLRSPARFHHEGPDPAPLPYDVVGAERPGQVHPGVDLLEQERLVLLGDRHRRVIDRRVGRTYDGPLPHRQYVEESLVVVEEGQDPARVGDLGYDKMYSLGEHQTMLGRRAGKPADVGHVRAAGVDDHGSGDLQVTAASEVPQADTPAVRGMCGGHHLHPVGYDSTMAGGLQSQFRDESGVVVDEEVVGVLDAAPHQRGIYGGFESFDRLPGPVSWRLGGEPSQTPVGHGAQRGEPRREWRPVVHGGQETGLGQPGRESLSKAVPGVAEAGHEFQVAALQVLEATPHHAGGLLAGPGCEVMSLHEGDP